MTTQALIPGCWLSHASISPELDTKPPKLDLPIEASQILNLNGQLASDLNAPDPRFDKAVPPVIEAEWMPA